METGILSFIHGFCDWGFWSLPFIMQRWSLSGYKNCNFVWTWITYELQTLTSREFSNFLQQVAKYKDRPQILQMMNYKFCLYTGILPEVRQKYSRRTNAQFPSSLTSKNGNIAIPYKSNQQEREKAIPYLYLKWRGISCIPSAHFSDINSDAMLQWNFIFWGRGQKVNGHRDNA